MATATTTKTRAAKAAESEEQNAAEAPAKKAPAKKAASAAKTTAAKKAPAKKPATRAKKAVDEIIDAPDETEVTEADEQAEEEQPAAEHQEPLPTGAIVLKAGDEEDVPTVTTAIPGATADPVKDYLKQIGKVALLNAAEEVELAMRIEAGLFARRSLAPRRACRRSSSESSSGWPVTASARRATSSARTCASWFRLRSATPGVACSSWT